MKRLGLLIGLVVCLVAFSQTQAQAALVGYWPLDGLASGTSNQYEDLSDVGNNGFGEGSYAFVPGVLDGAMACDGNDYVRVYANPVYDFNVSTSFSLTAWIRLATSSPSTSSGAIINRIGRTAAYNSPAWELYVHPAGLVRARGYSGGEAEADAWRSSVDVWDGKWHHVAAVFDRVNGLKLYVDGVLKATDTRLLLRGGFNAFTPGWNIDETSSSIGIGARESLPNYAFRQWPYWGPTQQFNGDLDDVRIYSHALDAVEIAQEVEVRTAIAALTASLGECETDLYACENPPCPTLAEVQAAANGACDPNASYRNHGAYVSCVSNAVETVINANPECDLDAIADAVVSAAAHTNIGK